MPRLFLGSFLSEEQQAAFARLPEINSKLASEWHCQIRWVKATKLHLTWLFIGHVEETVSLKLTQAAGELLKGLRLECPISIIFDRLEAWSVRRSPRHVVLTAGQPSSQFLDLATRLRTGLRQFGAEDAKDQAKKSFLPHITLMRLSPEANRQATLPTHLAADSTHPLQGHKKK